MANLNGSGSGGDDGGSLAWLLVKLLAVIIGVVVLLSFLMSIFKYIVALAVLGGLGYGGYRLLTGPKKELTADKPLLLESKKNEDPMERKLRLLEEEDRRLNEEIDRLSRE